jgi:Uncharacterized protein conserved in bacteria (DUF2059)
MFKLKLYLSGSLLVFCIFVTACVPNFQQEATSKVIAEKSNMSTAKRQLAKEVLAETGIAEEYDLHFNNITDITFPASMTNERFRNWLQGVLTQEAGWKHIEDQYITKLEANFSEAELTELLNLSKQPLMKKLLQTEIQAYSSTAKERRKLLDKVWNDYNSGNISVPPEVQP